MTRVPAYYSRDQLVPCAGKCPMKADLCKGVSAACAYYSGLHKTGKRWRNPMTVLCSAPTKKGDK